jgi:hypothetical protein
MKGDLYLNTRKKGIGPMLRFKKFLEERILSIGFNPKHEKHRENIETRFMTYYINPIKV